MASNITDQDIRDTITEVNKKYPEAIPNIIQQASNAHKEIKPEDIGELGVGEQLEILKSVLFLNAYGVTKENLTSSLYERLQEFMRLRPIFEGLRKKPIKDNMDYQYLIYYPTLLEFAKKNIEIIKNRYKRPLILGWGGEQGTGKSFKAELIAAALKYYGFRGDICSTDRFYKSHILLVALGEEYPHIYWGVPPRGPFGTHDITELIRVLTDIRSGIQTYRPNFKKELLNGEGDRDSKQVLIEEDLDFYIIDGSPIGAGPISKYKLCKLDTDPTLRMIEEIYDPHCKIRKFFNKEAENYSGVNKLIDMIWSCRAYIARVIEGRIRAEIENNQGMNVEKTLKFTYYYSLFVRNVREVEKIANVVLRIGENQNIERLIVKRPYLTFN